MRCASNTGETGAIRVEGACARAAEVANKTRRVIKPSCVTRTDLAIIPAMAPPPRGVAAKRRLGLGVCGLGFARLDVQGFCDENVGEELAESHIYLSGTHSPHTAQCAKTLTPTLHISRASSANAAHFAGKQRTVAVVGGYNGRGRGV